MKDNLHQVCFKNIFLFDEIVLFLEQLNSIHKYTYDCFICHSTDIDRVQRNPFRPPNDQT